MRYPVYLMNKKFYYLLFGLALLAWRLIINYSHDLIPGIGGGYYPVQIRAILETGKLAFRDMPLYFYLNALIVKMIWLISGAENDQVILHVTRILDSMIPPLMVIPFYKLSSRFTGDDLKWYFEIQALAYATLSIAPLFMVAEASKNSSAYPLMAFFLFYMFAFFRERSSTKAFFAVLFLILTGLTHFGVFTVSLTILLISLSVFYRLRAIPIIVIIVVGSLGFVYLFDPGRLDSMLWVPVTLFRNGMFRYGPEPYSLITYPATLIILSCALIVIFRGKEKPERYDRKVFVILLISIGFFSLPVLGREYFNRFSMILFIPMFILILQLFSISARAVKRVIVIAISLTVASSFIYMISKPKTPALSQDAYADLKKFGDMLENPHSTLVIPRHGIEWWTTWELRTKIGGTGSLDQESFRKYDQVLVLVHKTESYHKNMPVHLAIKEPEIPGDHTVFYESDHFLAVEIDSTDLGFYSE